MRIVISVLVAILTAFPVCAHENPGRNLGDYDLAGPYSLDRSSRHAEERPVLEGMIRDFLWTRWSRHRLAHVIMVEYSLEGLPVRTWCYVEPDKDGIWHIFAYEDVTLPALIKDSNEHMRKSQEYRIYSLERIEATGNLPEKRPIPNEEKRDPETYRLRLKDRDGKVIREL